MYHTYTGHDQQDLINLAESLEGACKGLEAITFARLQYCDRESDQINYLTCQDVPNDKLEYLERVVFMFEWSYYTFHNKAIFQSNADFIKKQYREVFETYFTDDTLTSDTTGIMLFLDRLIADLLAHKISQDTLDSIEYLIDDFESLPNYIILDEQAFSDIEQEDYNEAWDSWGKDDFIMVIEGVINELLTSQGQDEIDNLEFNDGNNDDGDHDNARVVHDFFREVSDVINGGEDFIVESGGVWIRIPDVDKMIEKLPSFIQHFQPLIDTITDDKDRQFALAAIAQKTTLLHEQQRKIKKLDGIKHARSN